MISCLDSFWLILVIGIFAAAFFYFFYSFYFAPWFVFPLKPESKPYTGQRPPPHLVRALFREVVSGVLFLGFYWFWPFVRGYQLKPRQRGSIPIIFVHGFAVSRVSWFWFMRMLARRDVTRPMYALSFNWLASSETSSKKLEKLIKRALKEQSAKQVDIVCHSWGGIVARWYLRRLGSRAPVRRLITISSPMQGTWTSPFGFGIPRREMSIGSDTVKALWTAAPNPPIATLWAACDEIVIPQQFSLLGDPDGNPVVVREFGSTAHLTMCRDGPVADMTANLLLADEWPG